MSRYDEWLAANGKVRGSETALDEIQWLREERQRLRITDAERETLEWAAREADQWEDDEPVPHQHAATLRGLRERLGGER